MFFSVFLPSYYRFQPISSSYSLLHFFPSIVAHSSPSASVSSGPCCWLSHLQRKSTRLISVSLLINFSLVIPLLRLEKSIRWGPLSIDKGCFHIWSYWTSFQWKASLFLSSNPVTRVHQLSTLLKKSIGHCGKFQTSPSNLVKLSF